MKLIALLLCCSLLTQSQYISIGFNSGSTTLLTGVFDGFIDMNGNTVGTTVTAAVMNTGTISNVSSAGAWAITGTGLTVGADQTNCHLPGNLYTNTTKVLKTHSSQSLAINHATSPNYASFSMPTPGIQAMSAFGCITFGATNISPSGNLYDLVRLDTSSSGLSIMQLNNGNCSGAYGVRIEATSPFGHSSCITVVPNSSYWYLLAADRNTGLTALTIWNSSLSQIGSVSVSSGTGDYFSIYRIGNLEAAADSGTSYFENSSIAWSNPGAISPISGFTPTIWHLQSLANGTNAGGVSTVAVTLPSTTLANDCLWGMAVWNSSSQTATVADNVNGSWTADTNGPKTGTGALAAFRIETFQKCGITAGSTTVTLTLSGNDNNFAIGVHEFYGTAGTIDKQIAGNTGTSATPVSTTTGTLSAANEYTVGGCVVANNITNTTYPWIPMVSFGSSSKFIGAGTEFQIVSATTAVNVSLTQNSSGVYICKIDTFQ